jgi:hypothetical protein
LYLVYLDPFVVQEHEDRGRKEGMAEPVGPQDMAKLPAASWDWHQIGVRRVAQGLARAYQLKVENITSWGGLSVSAYMNAEQAKAVMADEAVTSITQREDEKVVISAPENIQSGDETIPWGKVATNTNDNITTNNIFYLFDMAINNPNLPNEINYISISNVVGVNSDVTLPYHATHVAGLVGAKNNNSLIRGINPGQPIRHIGTYLSSLYLDYAFSSAALTSESNNEFGVLNISINTPGGGFSAEGMYGKWLRAISNRMLVTQSAGNNNAPTAPPPQPDDSAINANACLHAYYFPGVSSQAFRSKDGILVVGGTTQTGNAFTSSTNLNENNNNAPYSVPGSNYGACVEVWAPAHLSISVTPVGTTRVSTGTSYAAPTVAAIASRYGNAQTRPIEREQYILRNAVIENPPKYAGSFQINNARYAAQSAQPIPGRLVIASIYSPTSQVNLAKLTDAKFYNEFWNAGGQSGIISLDLGTTRTVTGVRITLRTSAPAVVPDSTPVNFTIFTSNTNFLNPENFLASWSELHQSDMAPVYIDPNQSRSARYIQISGVNQASWLAYSEVEVYGF